MGPLAESAILTVALVIMGVGLLGVILPVLPGLALVWIGALVFALAERFASVDPVTFAALTLLAALGVTADVWMTQLGARLGGASFKSQLAGLAGGVIGAAAFFLAGGWSAPVGAFLGSIAGVLLAEYGQKKAWGQAFRSGFGWMAGWLASTLLQLAIGVVMVLLFIWQVFRG